MPFEDHTVTLAICKVRWCQTNVLDVIFIHILDQPFSSVDFKNRTSIRTSASEFQDWGIELNYRHMVGLYLFILKNVNLQSEWYREHTPSCSLP